MRSRSRGAAAGVSRPRYSRRMRRSPRRLVLGLAPVPRAHSRRRTRACAKESTGHGSPLAPLVHGGPGRAGGGEELGGIRGVLHYMQRTAVQGTPDVITALGGRWVRGSRQRDPGRHPFRIAFNDLGSATPFAPAEREVSVEDIEQFAALTGDTFYAHMRRARGRAQSAVRRARRARIFPDLGRRGTVRRPRLRPGARQLRPQRAALRQAGQARRSDQGATHLRRRKACAPTRDGARSPGTPRSPIRAARPSPPTTCSPWSACTKCPIVPREA